MKRSISIAGRPCGADKGNAEITSPISSYPGGPCIVNHERFGERRTGTRKTVMVINAFGKIVKE